MSKLILLSGAPGSGKTTWAKMRGLKAPSPNYIIISRDSIRFSLVGEDEEYFAHETEVFNAFVSAIAAALKREDVLVVADATHLTSKSRLKLLNHLPANAYDTLEIVYFDTTLASCLERNEKRQGTRSYVPKSVIRRMWFQKQEPCFREGKFYYDAITIIQEHATIRRERTEHL